MPRVKRERHDDEESVKLHMFTPKIMSCTQQCNEKE